MSETIALITGASSGIGKSLSQRLIKNGHRVIGTARHANRLCELQNELGDKFLSIDLNVDQDASVDTLLERLPENWRQINILVNNAGHDVGGRKNFADGNKKHWLDIIETNVRGLIRSTYAILPGMLERDTGHIINLGSIGGLMPVPTTAVYSSSKHAVDGFSESLRLELADTGVRVSQILPGLVKTGFASARFGDDSKADKFYKDFGMWLEPEDVAEAIIYALNQPEHVVISQLVIVQKKVSR